MHHGFFFLAEEKHLKSSFLTTERFTREENRRVSQQSFLFTWLDSSIPCQSAASIRLSMCHNRSATNESACSEIYIQDGFSLVRRSLACRCCCYITWIDPHLSFLFSFFRETGTLVHHPSFSSLSSSPSTSLFLFDCRYCFCLFFEPLCLFFFALINRLQSISQFEQRLVFVRVYFSWLFLSLLLLLLIQIKSRRLNQHHHHQDNAEIDHDRI